MPKLKAYHKAPILALVIFVLTTISSSVDIAQSDNSKDMFFAVMILQIVTFLLPGLFYCRLHGQDSIEKLNLGAFRISSAILIIPASLLLFFTNVLVRLLGIYATDGAYSQQINTANLGFSDTVFVLLVYCVCPAVLEEFVFRGIILSEYKKYGAWCSIIISSALFSMMHFSMRDFLAYFACGIILACVAYVTRSVLPCIIMHLLNNVFSLFFEKYMWEMIDKPDNAAIFIFVSGSLVLFLLFVCFSQAERIVYGYSMTLPESTNPPKKEFSVAAKDFMVSLLSPSFLACAVYFIVASVVKAG